MDGLAYVALRLAALTVNTNSTPVLRGSIPADEAGLNKVQYMKLGKLAGNTARVTQSLTLSSHLHRASQQMNVQGKPRD